MGVLVVLSVAAVVYLLAGLVVLAHTVLQLDLWWAARRESVPPRGPGLADGRRPPRVLVQLPLYDEPRVVGRLLDAVGALQYPEGRWAVQVLDDSTDATTEIVRRWIADRAGRGLGPPFTHLRRQERTGFKAGALAAGLDTAPDVELVAVLDADFVPHEDFLVRCAARFASPDVAVVQGRWGHLNAPESWITRAQAVMLDNHFAVEQAGRQACGAFGAFNGSAGVLRVAAVQAVGGWRSTTLTEDFDLSMRLQLAGWRVVYDPSIEVPAELPGTLAGLRVQQHRWMRGVAQNARLHLVEAFRRPVRARVRLHLVGQVLETATFAAMAVQLLLAGPVAWAAATGRVPGLVAANLPLALAFLGLLPVYGFSSRHVSPSAAVRAARYGGFVLLSLGLTLHNAAAVLAGWTGRPAAFERTPKAGGGAPPSVGRRPRAAQVAEAALTLVVLAGSGAAVVAAPSAAAYLWHPVAWGVGCATLLVVRGRERRALRRDADGLPRERDESDASDHGHARPARGR